MMQLPITAFNDNKVLPYFVKKDKGEDVKEGIFTLYLYSSAGQSDSKVYYNYRQLRFDKRAARFKTRKLANDYARYRLGLDEYEEETI